MKKALRPCDVLNLSLYQLSIYYFNEISLGYTNNGTYKLKDCFLDMILDKNHINLKEQKTLEQIIEVWQDNFHDSLSNDSKSSSSDASCNSPLINIDHANKNLSNSDASCNSPILSFDRVDSPEIRETNSSSSSSVTLINNLNDTAVEADDYLDDLVPEKEPIVRIKGPATLKAIRAKELLNTKGAIIFDFEKKIWTVFDSGVYNIVRMYPPLCTCKDTNCHHIIAVKASLGEDIFVYSNTTTLSGIINNSSSGSKKKSLSGSKRKHHAKNSRTTRNKTIIENQELSLKYLMTPHKIF